MASAFLDLKNLRMQNVLIILLFVFIVMNAVFLNYRLWVFHHNEALQDTKPYIERSNGFKSLSFDDFQSIFREYQKIPEKRVTLIEDVEMEVHPTSASCETEEIDGSLYCIFKSICYDHKKQLFTRGSDWKTTVPSYVKDTQFAMISMDKPQVLSDQEFIEFMKPKKNVHWISGETYLFIRRYSTNIWHFLQSFLPFFEFLTSNHEASKNLQNIFMQHDYMFTPWQMAWFEMAMRMRNTNHDVTLFHFRTYPENDDHALCFEKMVVMHGREMKYPMFSDSEVYKRAREAFYGMMGYKVPSIPPPHITLLGRKGSRRIRNIDQLYDFVKKWASPFGYNVSIEYFDDRHPYEQFEVMRRSGILISLHGAAFANSMFLPPGAVMVELFPFSTYFYREVENYLIAPHLDLQYVAWENTDIRNVVIVNITRDQFSHLTEEEYEAMYNKREKEARDCLSKGRITSKYDSCSRFYLLESDTIIAMEMVKPSIDLALYKLKAARDMNFVIVPKKFNSRYYENP